MGRGRPTDERVTCGTWGRGLSLAVTAVLLAACGTPAAPPAPRATAPGATASAITPSSRAVTVSIGTARFTAEMADTDALRALGLSFRDGLQPGEAMWFDFGAPLETAFWMRGMRFPLDIIWVDEGLRVVHVTADAQPPDPSTPESALPLYRPGVPVRYVLEVSAGLAARHGIVPGVDVRVTAAP